MKLEEIDFVLVSVSLTDDPVPEPMLHVYDKSGKYPLSHKACREIKEADWLHFTSMWQSVAARNVELILKQPSYGDRTKLNLFISQHKSIPATFRQDPEGTHEAFVLKQCPVEFGDVGPPSGHDVEE